MLQSKIYGLTLSCFLASACSGGGSSPAPSPKAPQTASKSQDAASSGDATDSPLAQLSASGDGNVEVRDRQIGALKAQRDSYSQQLVYMQYYSDQLFSTDTTVQKAALGTLAKTTLSSAATGSAIAIGGGAAVSAITGNWASLLPSIPAAANMLSTGAANEAAQAKGQAAASQVSAEVAAQRDVVKAQIANLQTKITAIDDQIAALNALKL